ncbi:MAG: polyphosphate:AMP phosphotransferase [Oscillospiraceae bacterium]|nr:MAG: polyphosphate:AMP phosphotransferase [Oscillospiraceae bacterium]
MEKDTTADEKAKLADLQKKLAVYQQSIKKNKIPIIIILEGWGASGKGNVISGIIKELDPRGFKVYTTGESNEEEKKFPLLRRFWTKIPLYGNISIFDRSWYRDVSISAVEDGLSENEVNHRLRDISVMEKMLTDDGYLIIKIFLNITRKEQKKRFSELEKNKSTEWRVTSNDWRHNRMFDAYKSAFQSMIKNTNTQNAPWLVIDANNSRSTVYKALSELCKILKNKLDEIQCDEDIHVENKTSEFSVRTGADIKKNPIFSLGEVDLSPTMENKLYKEKLKKLQRRLFELHNEIYLHRRPLIIVFEGWDAAGKGGAIKRLVGGLDPRGYEVIPISAPNEEERNKHYLWRFWSSLPKNGHIAIFDRSWYGRVMVERIEGFCSEQQWKRAYEEINYFERELYERGTIQIKFWLHISPEEQLKRFNKRLENPEKNWKITEEDWRNREKWTQYETAVNDMLRYTNTDYSPWIIIPGNDKRYARLNVLENVISQLENEL